MSTTLDSVMDVRIHQQKDGYRFSMDAVFLATFVNMKVIKHMADFGAGSGIVGLLLARRYPESRVTLIEIQKGLHELCVENVIENELQGKVETLCADLRDLGKLGDDLKGLDLVVSNPPFRKPLSGRISSGDEKAIARHELKLSLPELLGSAAHSLRARGRFCTVYLPDRLADLIFECRNAGLEPKRMRFVHARQGAEARIVLLEAVKGGKTSLKVEPPLFVYKGKGQDYTPEVQKMYREGA
jgi:tRNA1Val (adenine37-N6)-methyltransferase